MGAPCLFVTKTGNIDNKGNYCHRVSVSGPLFQSAKQSFPEALLPSSRLGFKMKDFGMFHGHPVSLKTLRGPQTMHNGQSRCRSC